MGSDRPSSAAVLLPGASYKHAAVLGGKKNCTGWAWQLLDWLGVDAFSI